MKAEIESTESGKWYWVVVMNDDWYITSQATYTRRRDARRGLIRFVAGVGSVEIPE